MHTLNHQSSHNLLYGHSDSMRRIGIVFACIGAALAVAAVAAAGLPRMPILILSECGALAGIAGLLAALWVEELSVDLRAREFAYRKGFGRFCRRVHGGLNAFDRVTISFPAVTNLYGE